MARVIPDEVFIGKIWVDFGKRGCVDSHFIQAADHASALAKLVQIQNTRVALSPPLVKFPFASVSKYGTKGDSLPIGYSESTTSGTYSDAYSTTYWPFTNCLLLRQISTTFMHSNRYIHGLYALGNELGGNTLQSELTDALDSYYESLKLNACMVVFHRDTQTTAIEPITTVGFVRTTVRSTGRPFGSSDGDSA